jgi:O-antigen/teichoic acid export membrane protein
VAKRGKVISGLLWSLLNNFGRQGVTFVISIILARVLVPEDFGLIGMLTFFIAVSQALIEGGFSQTLIKEKDLTRTQLSTIFYINMSVGVVLYLILFIAAPFIAKFYNEVRLTSILRVMAISIVIRSLNIIQNVVQVRDLNFKAQFKSRVPSVIVGGVAGVVMAYSGFGVWSIVYQQLISHILILIGLWIQTPWTPALAFNIREVKHFFSLSSSLLFIRIVNSIFENI